MKSNLPVAAVEPFHAIAISRIAHDLKQQGARIIHMEFGQPSTGAPDAAIAEAHRVLDSEAMGYWESVPLKQRIARHYADRHGLAIDPEQVILTCGASPAFVMALSCLFRPGARVALARPGYVAYRNTLRAHYLEPVELACGPDERFQVTAAALAALDPAPDGLILASPANPTGTIIAEDELAAIAEVCRERGIRVISDEIYHGLSYGAPAASMLEHLEDALVVNSFSKYFSMPGWRLGWLVVPAALIGAARARMGNLFLTPPVIAQRAGLVAFDCEEQLQSYLATYARNRELMLAALPALGLDRIAPPDGAFYIYADIGHLTDDSLAFCEKLLRETAVATAPGIDFDPVDGRSFMRFSFAVSTAEVEEAIARMVPWFAAQPRR
ncbi:aminotransferase class I/II-fold pyridoxal phosphate-dependent enzyme [Novosphingobium flavum]|uniref:Aminotransferase n=1 Tax=Novosphingobium flavum TaxID=1778672 RepID=A0A7X1KLU1_9SPHN|nr:aminotransferase class I/II-fold pyridoxal phosphate-dependent enzyme [Novosphingobium flavum]MBC2665937.1 aminotransferase class I/II-fold pyridoxal phosphate-dependent enzyme [Novosphingobium flavum]